MDEFRRVEGERLDTLQAAVWRKAMAGDIDACATVLKVIDRRIQMFGLRDTSDDDKTTTLVSSPIE